MTTDELPPGGTYHRKSERENLYYVHKGYVWFRSGHAWITSQRRHHNVLAEPQCNPDGSPLPDARDAEIERLRTERDEAVEVLRKVATCSSLPDSVKDLVRAVLAKSPAPQPAPDYKATEKETNNE